MKTYEICEVSLTDPTELISVNRVVGDVFGSHISDDHIILNTKTSSSYPSLYLAAIEGKEIIGFNAFISHDFSLNNTSINCYQSCWTAISGRHRGKGIFQNLILSAHDILRKRGAGFVFGFPNENSHPLFTKKLGYREYPSLKWQVPTIPIIESSWFTPLHDGSRLQLSFENYVSQNDRQLIKCKQAHLGGRLIFSEYQGSLAWGVRRTKYIKGLSIPYLDIGGFELASPEHLLTVFRALRRKTNPVAYSQVTTIAGNSYNGLFNMIRRSSSNCLIVYDLNLDTSKNIGFNFFGGVRDVFK